MNEIVSELFPHLTSPAAILIVGYLLKNKLGELDKIPDIIMELKSQKVINENEFKTVHKELKAMYERHLEEKIKVESIERQREDFIILRSEVKTQWSKYDELNERLKELQS